MAKYRHWLEWADVTMSPTDVTLLQLQSTHPHLFATVLPYSVMLHVCIHFDIFFIGENHASPTDTMKSYTYFEDFLN